MSGQSSRFLRTTPVRLEHRQLIEVRKQRAGTGIHSCSSRILAGIPPRDKPNTATSSRSAYRARQAASRCPAALSVSENGPHMKGLSLWFFQSVKFSSDVTNGYAVMFVQLMPVMVVNFSKAWLV